MKTKDAAPNQRPAAVARLEVPHVGLTLRNMHQKCTAKRLRMQKTPGFPGVFIGGDGGI
jgi:hypothetical protein